MSRRAKSGFAISHKYRLTQHERDLILLKRIIESIGCGTIIPPSADRDRYNINVADRSALVNIIIPLFEKHPIYGAKRSDFLDFCKGMRMVQNGEHLTPEGLKALKDISHSMNTGRVF